MEETRFRRIHQREFEPETRDKFCSFELTFDLCSFTVQIHAGHDFDFDQRVAPTRVFEGLAGCNTQKNSQVVLQQVPLQKSPFVVEEDFFTMPINNIE